jgi:two-component system, OmpR family, phosphate regulon sensor histidine kinase PhoR
MSPGNRIRLALAYAVLVALVMGGLALSLTRPSCLGDAACLWGRVGVAALLLGGSAVGLALVTAERAARPIRHLTTVARRIAAGEPRARMLPHSRDDVGELIRAFNEMTDQLGRRLDQLGEERRQLATVLEYMADGVLIADEAGLVRMLNPAATRLLKTTETAALGRSVAQVIRHHQLIELWQRCRADAKEQIEAVEIESDLFLQAVVTPFHHGKAQGYLFILQDLTQVRRLHTMRRDFISNLSHELRTPLASLRAVIETLQDGALDDPPAAQRFLGRAEQEVDTLTQMVEELLELSHIESGQTPLRLAPTPIADLINLPVERLSAQAERGGVRLALEIPADLPPALADADRVRQVVTNLLHNAIKFTPPGGTVTISAYVQRKVVPEVVVAVRDTGVGIAPAEIPRIFERFYKSDRARTRSGGTGLGLAIARHIIQAHNGRIWVQSKERQGSVFFFSLPIPE